MRLRPGAAGRVLARSGHGPRSPVKDRLEKDLSVAIAVHATSVTRRDRGATGGLHSRSDLERTRVWSRAESSEESRFRIAVIILATAGATGSPAAIMKTFAETGLMRSVWSAATTGVKTYAKSVTSFTPIAGLSCGARRIPPVGSHNRSASESLSFFFRRLIDQRSMVVLIQTKNQSRNGQ